MKTTPRVISLLVNATNISTTRGVPATKTRTIFVTWDMHTLTHLEVWDLSNQVTMEYNLGLSQPDDRRVWTFVLSSNRFIGGLAR